MTAAAAQHRIRLRHEYGEPQSAAPHPKVACRDSVRRTDCRRADGAVCRDCTGPLDEIGDWSSIPADAELNVAIGLARLGMNVCYLTGIGADSLGRSTRGAMYRECVSCDLVRTDASRPTGFILKSLAVDGSDPVTEYGRQGSAASFLCLDGPPVIVL